MDAKKIAKMFGCTEEQAKAQYARNAAQLAEMEAKANSIGRKVNGFTAQQLANLRMKAENNAR